MIFLPAAWAQPAIRAAPDDPAGLRLQADAKAASCGYGRYVSTQSPPPRPRQARPRPPLTKRLRPGHWVALDVLAAVVFTIILTAVLQRGIDPPRIFGQRPGDLLMAFALAVAVSLPVALRRRRPLAAFAVAAAAATLAVALVPAGSAPYFYLPAAYVLYLVAAVSPRRTAVAALGALLALVFLSGLLVEPARVAAQGVPAALIVIITWGFGYAVGQRRAYAEQLRDQAATSAVTDERLRIARELHDVVAHSMTVIAVQAGYGHHVIDAQPARAREALGAIQATSREALAEMRRMLGILRQPGAEPFGRVNGSGGAGAARPENVPGALTRISPEAVPLAPAPGLADLDRLAARVAQAGVRVDLRVRGSRRELPPGIDLSAFRIVQEALTNVVKHADTPSCRVIVSYGTGELSVEITDDGRGAQVPAAAGPRGAAPGGERGDEPAGGHGLIGMRERVSLYGGELAAGPLPERGFRVAARLPTGEAAP
jgi:signal transduction histidine kinase